MKKLILMAGLLLPLFVSAQADIPADKLSAFPNYVQVQQAILMKGLKAKNHTSVSSSPNDVHKIVGTDGKGYPFGTDAEVINYMDRQGFDFVTALPLPPGVGGASPFLRNFLFKRKQ